MASADTHESELIRLSKFAGQMYGAMCLSFLAWATISGQHWDWPLLTAMTTSGCGYLLSLTKANEYGARLLKVLVFFAAATFTVLTPLYATHTFLLIVPAIGAVYVSAALSMRWIALLIPPALAYGYVWVETEGVREGAARTVATIALWYCAGLIPAYLRKRSVEQQEMILEAQRVESERMQAEADRRAADAQRVSSELAARESLAVALRESFGEVTAASVRIESDSTQIATSVQELAQSLQETDNVAELTAAALLKVLEASDESQRSIGLLGSAGAEIVGIVDTITALAEQTNMLALNANIEAARAGERGQAFAVVADEVKQLAQRTSQSASGIANIVDRVHERLQASSEASNLIAELVKRMQADQASLNAAVSQQVQVVQQISTASNNEADQVSEMTSAIQNLNENATALAAVGATT